MQHCFFSLTQQFDSFSECLLKMPIYLSIHFPIDSKLHVSHQPVINAQALTEKMYPTLASRDCRYFCYCQASTSRNKCLQVFIPIVLSSYLSCLQQCHRFRLQYVDAGEKQLASNTSRYPLSIEYHISRGDLTGKYTCNSEKD